MSTDSLFFAWIMYLQQGNYKENVWSSAVVLRWAGAKTVFMQIDSMQLLPYLYHLEDWKLN